MPVLEICQLKVKSNFSPTDPSLLAALSKARSELRERVVDTKSQFYQCIEDPSLIYILGIWPSLERHHEFLTSPEKPEILDSQQDLFEFGYILHIPIESMDAVPLEAKVMGIARLHIKSGENVRRYESAVEMYRAAVAEVTEPYPLVAEWRVDSEEEKQEHVFLTASEEAGDHTDLTKYTSDKFPDYSAARYNYESIDIKHAKNMERSS